MVKFESTEGKELARYLTIYSGLAADQYMRAHLKLNHSVVSRKKLAEFLLVPILQLVRLKYVN